MCFSAEASFTAAAVIGGIGAVSVWKAAKLPSRRTLMFAAIPLMFAAQQVVEGLLWLEMENSVASTNRSILIHGFLGFAVFFWPIYAPVSAYLIEPETVRRRWILACVACGVIVSVWWVFVTLDHPYNVRVRPYGLVYKNGFHYPWFQIPMYVLATTLAFTFSSHRLVRIFSIAILVGLAVATIGFKNAYISVWCFFAAVASIAVFAHVNQSLDTPPESAVQPST